MAKLVVLLLTPRTYLPMEIFRKHLNMDHMLTHPQNFKSRHIYSIKKKLQNNYETFWKINLNKCEKLRTYRKSKFIFRYETYISDIRNISHRNILTRFHYEIVHERMT
jgi:hypothetical protein